MDNVLCSNIFSPYTKHMEAVMSVINVTRHGIVWLYLPSLTRGACKLTVEPHCPECQSYDINFVGSEKIIVRGSKHHANFKCKKCVCEFTVTRTEGETP